jgi:hypothetical protein
MFSIALRRVAMARCLQRLPLVIRSYAAPALRARAHFSTASATVSDDEDAKIKCDPYEQNGKPLSRDESDAYLARLDGWKIFDLPAAAAPPPIIPNFAPSAPPPVASAGGCGSNCACAAKGSDTTSCTSKTSTGGCASGSCSSGGCSSGGCSSGACSTSSTAKTCCSKKPAQSENSAAANAPAASSSPVTGSGANARRFKGGLVLRREWYFRTVNAGMDFIDQIKIISTNRTFLVVELLFWSIFSTVWVFCCSQRVINRTAL